MNKYSVKVETFQDKLINDLGELTLKEIKDLARTYIGDVFDNLFDVQEDIDYIKQTGEELWLSKHDHQIKIEKVGDIDE